MNPPDERSREVFVAAVQMRPEVWDAYLSEACGADEGLRRRVRGLLDAHRAASSFLESPAPYLLDSGEELPIQEAPGTVIGPYKLAEEIGEGGMGLVFVAEQEHPVRRRVALKVIKPGLDTRQVIARFEAERQALALMDHPNVARVLDAGATESGRPYFVMELIRGVPITVYCDQCELTTRERLELFIQVCQGVQHAHQKGIIHRDVKPTNVLVAMQDGRPVAKVIDFGVAKAINQRLTQRTILTGFAQMLGTPLYMSPEQADMSPLALDTRTDVYSLGVLLYELLTGTTPFEGSQLGEASFDEVRRVIRDVEPPAPSTRISTLGERVRAIAERRRTDPRRLNLEVRGDLDWIAMKALEKDRARRYETASALAADVGRYLGDEPVEACPPSRGYRLRKLIRRNRTSIAVAGGLTVAFAALAGSFGWMAWEQSSRRVVLEREVAEALEEADSSYRRDRVSDAMAAVKRAEGLLASGGEPIAIARRVRQWRFDLETVLRLETIRAEEVMERGEEEDDPGGARKDGAFRRKGADAAYGAAFREGNIEVDALTPDESAERIRRSVIREQLLAALDNWALARSTKSGLPGPERLLDIARRADADPWRNRVREAFERRDKNTLLELAEEPVMQPPTSIHLLARALRDLEEDPAAIRVLRRAQEEHPDDFWLNIALGKALERSRPDKALGFCRAALALRPGSMSARFQLGNALLHQGELDEAIAAYLDGIELDPGEGFFHVNLGVALMKKGLLDDAVPSLRRGVELLPEEPLSHFNLAKTLSMQGKKSEATDSYERAIELNPGYVEAHHNLGQVLWEQGRVDEALAQWRRAVALRPDLARAHQGIAGALHQKGDFEGCVAAMRKVIEIQPDAEGHFNLGLCLFNQSKWDEAIAAYQKAIELDPGYAKAHLNLAIIHRRQGMVTEAIAGCRKAIELSPELIEGHVNLGLVLSDQDELAEAIEAFGRALELDGASFEARHGLGNALVRQGKVDDAVVELRAAIALRPDVAQARDNLGMALFFQGKLDEAIAEYQRAIELAPSEPMSHANLGSVLRGSGRLAEALLAYKRCHELGSRDPRWQHPSADWIAHCEELITLEGRLPRVLAGEDSPADARERLAFASLGRRTRRFELAVRFFEEVFADEPALAKGAALGHRYDAACAAALSGAGEGRDSGALDDQARARRRRQALEWLRADLARHASRMRDPSSRATIIKTLRHWLREPDLRGLRDDAPVAELPAAERQAWDALWRDVRELLRKVEEETG